MITGQTCIFLESVGELLINRVSLDLKLSRF